VAGSVTDGAVKITCRRPPADHTGVCIQD